MKMVAARRAVHRHIDQQDRQRAADYPYDDFKELYTEAWKAGLKGPGDLPPEQRAGLGIVGHARNKKEEQPQDFVFDRDRRIVLEVTPTPALASLRWPGRPSLPREVRAGVSQVREASARQFRGVRVAHFQRS